ncbi:NRAMP (natural resistance-associated macrophage protein)-like metal ion transporter [Idiomarina fontislapidosi]|uniref:Manganese transporter n=1 Tax=Idiomarina fontislapidosi TaxID=263723 RepID=A0A432Y7Z6_9GAMM|nr:divalent metal cation transporter [Idiomarina fontislapidosi]PYE32391.1 NRAMP (natural resistance-associated macrophage protein)-like metal ion transporter [Idiomarina fontislapidosi]RUO57094.1 manganese transporter [Idiomarina fontislapidosi]
MKLSQFGPGALVAAAFIGPGTVVTASLAGAGFGYALLWALVLSTLICVILQEMASRIGVVTGHGLGENIRQQITAPWLRILFFTLIIAAIIVGNSVYQGGNLSGATLGAQEALGHVPWLSNWFEQGWPVIFGVLAATILWQGKAKFIEYALISLVLLMSLAFIGTFLLTQPNWLGVTDSLLRWRWPSDSILTVIALVGTTVVPYNLFLHSASVANKWSGDDGVKAARIDTFISIPLGGLISMAILATAASAFFAQGIAIDSAGDLAISLAPLFGDWAKYLMALGLCAAGISSATTAPLASAYALCGIMGWRQSLTGRAFRTIWAVILLLGVVISSLGISPIKVIWFAQIANGVLLPVIVGFIWWLCNQSTMGKMKNSILGNTFAALIMLISIVLSWKSLHHVWLSVTG